MTGDGELLPLREAAAAMDINPDALRARVRRGSIEAHKESAPPHRWMVRIPDAARTAARADVDAAVNFPSHAQPLMPCVPLLYHGICAYAPPGGAAATIQRGRRGRGPDAGRGAAAQPGRGVD